MDGEVATSQVLESTSTIDHYLTHVDNLQTHSQPSQTSTPPQFAKVSKRKRDYVNEFLETFKNLANKKQKSSNILFGEWFATELDKLNESDQFQVKLEAMKLIGERLERNSINN